MQLGRKLAEGYALDPEADELEPPITAPEEQPEPEPVELTARV
jgi:hypothetical protein